MNRDNKEICITGAKVKTKMFKLAAYCAGCNCTVFVGIEPRQQDNIKCIDCRIADFKKLYAKTKDKRALYAVVDFQKMKDAGY
jgi:hypothetical protein